MGNEQQYIKGFNQGYIVTKYNPSLMNSISATLSPSNSYLEGMVEGKQEMEFEQMREQLEEFENLRGNSYGRENESRRA